MSWVTMIQKNACETALFLIVLMECSLFNLFIVVRTENTFKPKVVCYARAVQDLAISPKYSISLSALSFRESWMQLMWTRQ